MVKFSRSEDLDLVKGTPAVRRNSVEMMKIVKRAEEIIMEFELGKSYEELEIGEKSSFSKTISETDVYLFAGISGDFNQDFPQN